MPKDVLPSTPSTLQDTNHPADSHVAKLYHVDFPARILFSGQSRIIRLSGTAPVVFHSFGIPYQPVQRETNAAFCNGRPISGIVLLRSARQ